MYNCKQYASSESELIRQRIQRNYNIMVQYTTQTALLIQNIMRVKIFTKVANQKDFGKFRFNVQEATLKKAALKIRI